MNLYNFAKVQYRIKPHCLEKQSVLVSPALAPGPVSEAGLGGCQTASCAIMAGSWLCGRTDPSLNFRVAAF